MATVKEMVKSSGHAGEQAAEYWFKKNGWRMWKVEPPSRVVQIAGRLQVIYAGKGYPDYLGYEEGQASYDYMFRAVEIKQAVKRDGNSVPASRLSKAQRRFMSGLPVGTAYVGILWQDGNFEMFPYQEKGSYVKNKSRYWRSIDFCSKAVKV